MSTVAQFEAAAQASQRQGVVGNLAIDHHISVQRGLAVYVKVPRGTSKRSLSDRGAITTLSETAKRRMRVYLRNSVAEYSGFVTLTYPEGYPSNGKAVKEHLRRMGQEIMREWKRQYGEERKNAGVFWFLEFQARGAPHFHLFITHWLRKDWVSSTWYRIVGSEDKRHLAYGTNIQALRAGRSGAMGYAMKYAAKSTQKVCPPGYTDVGRWWGIIGCRATVTAAIRIAGEHMKSEPVRARARNLEQTFDRMVRDGRAKTHLKTDTVHAIMYTDDSIRQMLVGAAYMLKCTDINEYGRTDADIFGDDEASPELMDFVDGYVYGVRR